jgi:hypothetical protein
MLHCNCGGAFFIYLLKNRGVQEREAVFLLCCVEFIFRTFDLVFLFFRC